jgi:hypothetical protein
MGIDIQTGWISASEGDYVVFAERSMRRIAAVPYC